MTCDTRTRVMLVDDHQVLRDLLRDALENTGIPGGGPGGRRSGGPARGGGSCPGGDRHGRDHAGDGWHRRLPGDYRKTARHPGFDADRSNEQEAVVRSIAAGATGYLQKYSGKEQLLTTLREVAEASSASGERGPAVVPDGASGPGRRRLQAVRSPDGTGAGDSEAVRPGVELPGDRGDTRHQRPTVRNAMSGIQRKLGFRTRQQLVVWAVRIGLVDDGPVVALGIRHPVYVYWCNHARRWFSPPALQGMYELFHLDFGSHSRLFRYAGRYVVRRFAGPKSQRKDSKPETLVENPLSTGSCRYPFSLSSPLLKIRTINAIIQEIPQESDTGSAMI